jgi:hypothetical protein
MAPYTLLSDGDPVEKHYYDLFIARDFPSYQAFWQEFVTPLSRRPVDIQLKDAQQLAREGKTDHDVCLAQLHYSILLHLIRAFDIRQLESVKADELLFGLTSLCGAQDIAFELLERVQKPDRYPPWPTIQKGRLHDHGIDAQWNWKKAHNFPLQDVRDYRNRLVHGRMPPTIVWANHQDKVLLFKLPRMRKEGDYFDWRKVTLAATPLQLPHADFDDCRTILSEAWGLTTKYLEENWKEHLLPHIH